MPELQCHTAPQAPSLRELFLGFAQISLSGFGGVLPWARRTIIEQRGWMSAAEFNEILALCQFLPGPNIVNLSVLFGARRRGLLGAAVALLGLLGPPFLIILLLGMLYNRFGHLQAFRGPLAGLAAAAAGLVIAVVIKMVQPLLESRFWPAPLIAAAAFLSVGVGGLPLPLVVAVLTPLSIGLCWKIGR